jgi:hypothetical protein
LGRDDIREDADDMVGLHDAAARHIHQVEAIMVCAKVVQRVGVNLDAGDAWLSFVIRMSLSAPIEAALVQNLAWTKCMQTASVAASRSASNSDR